MRTTETKTPERKSDGQKAETYETGIARITKQKKENKQPEEVKIIQTKKGTYLSEATINMIKRDFCNEQEYAKRTGHLFCLRNLLSNAIGEHNKTEHKLYPLLITINDLVGALVQYDIHFDHTGRAYKISNGGYEYI